MKLETLYVKFNKQCYWCKRFVFFWEATRDHYYPVGSIYKNKEGKLKKRGGSRMMGKEHRIVLACKFCNSQRGDMPAEEFARKIKNHEIWIPSN